MKRMCFFLVFPLCLMACTPVEDTRPGQPVKNRQMAFQAILRAFEPMGVMLRTDTVDAARFAKHALQLDQAAEKPWGFFGRDTLYPPSKAISAVWEDADRFAAEKDRFVEAVHQLLSVVQSGDKEKIAARYQQVHQSCKSCHEHFKQH